MFPTFDSKLRHFVVLFGDDAVAFFEMSAVGGRRQMFLLRFFEDGCSLYGWSLVGCY